MPDTWVGVPNREGSKSPDQILGRQRAKHHHCKRQCCITDLTVDHSKGPASLTAVLRQGDWGRDFVTGDGVSAEDGKDPVIRSWRADQRGTRSESTSSVTVTAPIIQPGTDPDQKSEEIQESGTSEVKDNKRVNIRYPLQCQTDLNILSGILHPSLYRGYVPAYI